MADSLRRLLGDAAMREEMGRAGSRHAQDYSWQEVSGRVLNYYEDTITAGASA